MARVLTAARARVAPANRVAYRDVLAELAECRSARGEHFWLFELHNSPGTFLEFREGGADADDAGIDASLEQRLEQLAEYDASRYERWDAVTLPTE